MNYYLRNRKVNSIEVPVQLTVSSDTTFLNTLADHTEEMSDDSENMSGSEVDLDRLVNDSDENESRNDTQAGSSAQSDVTRSSAQTAQLNADVQNAINAQILEQLDRLGKRLDSMENQHKKTADKSKIKSSSKSKDKTSGSNVATIASGHVSQNSSNLPENIQALRQDALVQAQVEQRLLEITQLSRAGTDSRVKSQCGGKIEVLVKNRVKWPHEYVLSGPNKERIGYDQLTVTQWVAGFGRTIKEESDAQLKEHMIDYMIALMDDANDFSWSSAKSSHAVLLCRMEQGEISDFSDTPAIERVRRANAQRHMPNIQNSGYQTQSTGGFKRAKTTKSMPCTFFNQGTCMQQKSHETRGVWYKHICAACFANTGKTFAHAEADCKNKSKFPKND